LRQSWRRDREAGRHRKHPTMSRVKPRPILGQQSGRGFHQHIIARLRRWRLRTIRGRLLVGFSATLAALVASGVLSILAIQRLYRDMGIAVASGNRISTMLFEGYDATLRYVATAQATLLDASPQRIAEAE